MVAKPEGGGLGAMAFLKGKPGDSDFISAFTSKWIIAGQAAASAPATLTDLTPIVMLADEIQVVAAPVDAPFNTMAEFLTAAKGNPGEMVQTGGSPNSVDNLVALEIQKNTGTKWKYLSFDDGAPRITAMLRGDAQIDIGALPDFADQIDAGKLKLIGVFSDKRLPDYPDVPTIAEQKIDLGEFPDHLQFRGIAGPPKMSDDAVKFYQDFFQKVSADRRLEAVPRQRGSDARVRDRRRPDQADPGVQRRHQAPRREHGQEPMTQAHREAFQDKVYWPTSRLR